MSLEKAVTIVVVAAQAAVPARTVETHTCPPDPPPVPNPSPPTSGGASGNCFLVPVYGRVGYSNPPVYVIVGYVETCYS